MSTSRVGKNFKCPDCAEDEGNVFIATVARSTPICVICGSDLEEIPNTGIWHHPLSPSRPYKHCTHTQQFLLAPSNTDVDTIQMDDLYERIGTDLREMLEDLNQSRNPSRKISVEYLSTLGKITVDDRKTILVDIYFSIGPLKMLAVSANFGFLPSDIQDIESRIILGSPIYGETELDTTGSQCQGAIILLKRGKVSFAKKALRAVEAGAAAVVIAQEFDVWPFLMGDSGNELNTLMASNESNKEERKIVPIPVLMIR